MKKTVAIIYGGRSTEHEISIKSARNIAEAIDSDKYNTLLIGADKTGNWFLKSDADLASEDIVSANDHLLAVVPGAKFHQIVDEATHESIGKVDVVFPIIHGTGGEDGTLQGLLTWARLPYVGPDTVGSVLCIDKEVAKRLLRDAGIPNAKFHSYTASQKGSISFQTVESDLGLPMYVKPPNLGSSVGISKVNNEDEFYKAIDLAFKYDKKVLIEENVTGREIECAVIGNTDPKASPPGEVVTVTASHDFYSYEAKYLDADGAVTKIPAEMAQESIDKIRELAIETYECLCCEGMARVDVFLKDNGDIYVNEVNTIPGFTDISMYPKLWGATGVSYSDLITQLLELAMERFDIENKREVSI